MRTLIAGIVVLTHGTVAQVPIPNQHLSRMSEGVHGRSSSQNEPDGWLVVTLEEGNAVAVLDAATGAHIARIDGLAAPHEIISSRQGRWAFVAETGATSVAEIDLTTASISRRFELGDEISPHDLVLSADESALWVASGSADVVMQIDLSRGLAGAAIPTLSTGSWMIAGLSSGRVVTANLEGGSVSVISIVGDTVNVIGPTANAMALVEPSPGLLWAGNADADTLAWIDVIAGAVVRRSSLHGYKPVRLRGIPHRGEIAMVASTRLILLEPHAANITVTMNLPHPAKNVAFSQDGHWAFVTHPSDDAVSVVDLVRRVFVRTFPVDGNPDSVTWVRGLQEP